MDETYDEFSEVVAAQVLPPMASTALEMAHAAVLEDHAENLDMGTPSGSDDGDAVEEHDGAQLEYGQRREDTQRVARAESDDDVADDMDVGEADDEPYVDEVEPDDLEVGDVGGGDDEAQPGENSHGGKVNPDSPPRPTATSVDHAPPFAISRVKSLFAFAEQTSRSTSDVTLPTCVLSTEGAYALSEAVALMLTDLVRAASDETQRRGKKTVTFDDVAFVGANLDRFAFVRDLMPVPTATLKGTIESRAQHQPLRSAAATAAEAKPRRLRVTKGIAEQGRVPGNPHSSLTHNSDAEVAAETTAPKQRQTTLTSFFTGR